MKRISKFIILSLILIIGGTQCSDVAPDEAEITISPDSADFDDTVHEFFHSTFTITVKDSNGSPLNAVEITIDFVWATGFNCPEPNCTPVVRLLDKDMVEVDSPFTTRTLEDGTYPITLRLYAKDYSYTGELTVRSGTAYADAEIKMNQ